MPLPSYILKCCCFRQIYKKLICAAHNSLQNAKEIRGSTCLCKFPLVQQQIGCGVTVRDVVEVDQGAVEDQVDLQCFTVRHNLKQLVL